MTETCAGRLALSGVLAAHLMLPASEPASAQQRQPSLSCTIADTNVGLDLYLPLSRDGSGNAARGMRGDLEIRHQKVARDRRKWPLEDKLPAQFWNSPTELKVRLLLSPPGDSVIDLVIETRAQQGGGPHTGTYRLETGEGVKVQGRVECSVG